MKNEWRYTLVGTIISWSFGYFGADRFYKGETGLGVLKLLTVGGVGVWWIIDALMWTKELGELERNAK
ncbi:TM2 domain-containing protein [Candidatus Saccharibacteria bacterium]|nr:TM2 domain-containing protein [Candidatus Saccharibacteria bacterium]